MSAPRKGIRPPRLAEKLLSALVGHDARGRSILGDAHEEMVDRARLGAPLAAYLWYWGYVLRFMVTYGAGGSGGSGSGLGLMAGIRHAARALVRRPGLALTVVVTLALGIGATTLTFALVDGVLLRPLPYNAPDELVHLSRVDPDWFDGPATASDAGGWYATPPATFLDWQSRTHSFAEIGAYAGASGFLQTSDEPVRIVGAMATSGVFAALGIPAFRGRTLLPEDDELGAEPVILLSHGLWMRQFGGDPTVLGRSLRIDNTSYKVVGVMPADFAFPSEATDFWMPGGDGFALNENRNGGYLHAVARLAPGATLEDARQDMRRVTDEMAQAHPVEAEFEALVFPLRDVTVARASAGLLLLLAAALVVLLVGCVNVTSLLLSRSAERRREFAVHAALGAGSGRLAGLVLGESLLLSSVGGVLGCALAWGSLGPFLRALPMSVPRVSEISIDIRVVTAALILTVGLGVVVALIPALRTGRTELNTTLRGGAHGTTADKGVLRGHGTLIVAEVALAVVLLSASGLFLESHRISSRQDPGFDPSDAISFYLSVPALREADGVERTQFFAELVSRLEAIPGVGMVALASQMPVGGPYSLPPAGVQTGEGVEETIIHSSVVSPSYFDVMDIPLLSGRGFNASDVDGAAPVTVVSEALARRYWPGEDPVGKRIRIGGEDDGVWHDVVGMVGNVRYAYARPEAVEYYRATSQYPLSAGSLVMEVSGPAPDVAPAAAAVVRQLLPDVPISVAPLDQRMRRDTNFRWARLAALILSGLGGVAVFLSLLGVYSVLSYAVVRRTRDIGIRVSLGGTAPEILREVLGGFLALAGLGVAVGVALAAASASVVKSALVGEAPSGPGILLTVSGMVLLTVVCASLIPAMRALRTDPLVAFKAD